MTIKGIGEFELIAGLLDSLQEDHKQLLERQGVIGAGDDCAVMPLGLFGAGSSSGSLLATSDICLEGVHFDLSYFEPEDIGWKALAVSLSDISSMGGKPLVALINLQLREELEFEWCRRVYAGIGELAKRHQVAIVGGDTVLSSQLGVEVSLLGRAELPVFRSGAQDGDDIWLSGEIGYSGAGLKLFRGADLGQLEQEQQKAKTRHLRPCPRVKLGLSLEKLANSMIDVSDGLLQDSGHLCKESSVSFEIEVDKIRQFKSETLEENFSLSSGEDFELLFTCSNNRFEQIRQLEEVHNVKLTCIGEVKPRQEWMISLRSSTAEGVEVSEIAWGERGLGYDHLS